MTFLSLIFPFLVLFCSIPFFFQITLIMLLLVFVCLCYWRKVYTERYYSSTNCLTFIFNFISKDGGPDHKMSAYTDVKINIIDGNDNKPAFMYSGCLQHRLHCILPRYTANFNSIVIVSWKLPLFPATYAVKSNIFKT